MGAKVQQNSWETILLVFLFINVTKALVVFSQILHHREYVMSEDALDSLANFYNNPKLSRMA